jgi:hypothetical protein
MANIDPPPLEQQRDEMHHLGKQVGSLKTLVRDALSSLEDARLNMPMTVDREEVDQKLEQFYERLHKITQQDTDFLEEKWQNQ